MERAIADLKPEATYFTAMDGQRTSLMFFDLADVSDIPMIGERFFFGVNAGIELTPAMTAEDLRKGLPAAMAYL